MLELLLCSSLISFSFKETSSGSNSCLGLVGASSGSSLFSSISSSLKGISVAKKESNSDTSGFSSTVLIGSKVLVVSSKVSL